jgi:hypothetical protein
VGHELFSVQPRPTAPPAQTSRPPEPIRPLPAQRAGVSLLSLRVRRRRYRNSTLKGR